MILLSQPAFAMLIWDKDYYSNHLTQICKIIVAANISHIEKDSIKLQIASRSLPAMVQ